MTHSQSPPPLRVVPDADASPEAGSADAQPAGTVPDPVVSVALSASAAAALVASIRIAAHQGTPETVWSRHVDQSCPESIAAWLYARMLKTDPYHPTRRGHLPFVYESPEEAANAFLTQDLRTAYPHLSRSVREDALTILAELMSLSGHLPGSAELAWGRRNRRVVRSLLRHGIVRPGRWLLRLLISCLVFFWFLIVAFSGERQKPTDPRRARSTPAAPSQPTTPAPPSRSTGRDR